MAANVGGLRADLALQTAAFIKGATKAQNHLASETAKMRRSMASVDKATRGLSKSVSGLKAGIGALAGALAVRQFSKFTKQALDSADAIGKTADSIGLSTSALQELRVSAGLAGVGVEKFDKSIQKFTRNIGDARNGTGTLATTLKATAPAFLAQLKATTDTEQALNLYLKRLADTSNAQDRAALSAAAFGREGVNMVNIVREGVAGLEAMRGKAVDLGLVLEESLIRKAEQVNDRMLLLKGAFATGFQRSIIDEFNDAFQLTDENINAAREAGEKFGQAVGATMKAVADAAKFAAENMRAIGAAIAAIIAFKASVIFLGIAAAVRTYAIEVRAAAAATGFLNAAIARNPIGLLAVGIAAAVGGYIAFGNSAANANSAEVSLNEALTDGNRLLVEANTLSGEAARLKRQEAVERFNAAKAIAEETRQTALASAAQIEGQLARMNAPRGAGAVGDAGLAADIQKLGGQTTGAALEKRLAALRKTAADAAAAVAEYGEKIKGIINPTVDAAKATADAAEANEKAAKVFKDGTKSLERQVAILRLEAAGQKDAAAALKRRNEGTDLLNRLTKDGIVLNTTQITKLRALIAVRDNLTKTIKEQADAEKKAQEATADALAKQAQQEEERRRILQQPFLNAIDGIQDAFSTGFQNIFEGGVNSFADMAVTVKKIMIRLAAEVATLLVFKPVIGDELQAFELSDLNVEATS